MRDLEKVIKDVQPMVREVMNKFLGISIIELDKDISEKIGRSPLMEFSIDINKPFKECKRLVKKTYLERVLRMNYGNISEVAKTLGIDRRSVHRIIKDAGIDVESIRFEMIKPYAIQQSTMNKIIENVLKNYKTVIHPDKLKNIYSHVDDVSNDILSEVPFQVPTLKQAEEEFEKQYIELILKATNNNLKLAATKSGLRYETFLRKRKKVDGITK